MKIKKIRFQNLNSLEGEWTIDFSHTAYSADGIFAITGPTGAGKTTILDAVCLALYGRTPRLERVNKSGNEIMSRRRASCFAEVDFTTREGSYRCHWSQQRAHKNLKGELQPPRHEIADAKNGKVLENKIRDVAARVEQITGMNFTRFTRSILLAQGGFAAFLQAPADERAPILEQITGTEIYSEISVKVHEKLREEKDILELLQAGISGIKLLTAEEENILRRDIETKSIQEIELKKDLKDLQSILNWLERTQGLEKEIEEIEQQSQEYLLRKDSFQGEALRLERARQAAALDIPFTRLQGLRDLQNNDLNEIGQIHRKLPEQSLLLGQTKKQWENSRQEFSKFKSLRKSEGEIAKNAREMDILLEQQAKLINSWELAIKAAGEECGALQEEVNSAQEETLGIRQVLSTIEEYQRVNTQDKNLLTDMTGIIRVFERLQGLFAAWQEKGDECQQAIDVLRSLQDAEKEIAAVYDNNQELQIRQLEVMQTEKNKLRSSLQGHEIKWWRDELERLKGRGDKLQSLKELGDRIFGLEEKIRCGQETIDYLSAQQEQLLVEIKQREMKIGHLEAKAEELQTRVLLLSRIRDLEEERAHLEDGKACPLCGATEHPYAQGNIPRMDESQKELQETQKQLKELSEDLKNKEKDQGRLGTKLEHEQLAFKQAETELDEARGLYREDLQALGLGPPVVNTPSELEPLAEKSQKSIAWHSRQLKMIEELQKNIEELNGEYDKVHTAFNEADKELQAAVMRQGQADREEKRLHKEHQGLENELEQLQKETLRELKQYGIDDLPWEKLTHIRQTLEERKRLWEAKDKDKQEYEQMMGKLQNEIQQKQLLLKDKSAALKSGQEILEQQLEEYRQQRKARFDLYGERDPDEEEARMDEEIKLLEETLGRFFEEFQDLQHQQLQLEEREKNLADAMQNRAPQLQKLEGDFIRQLQQAGFEQEKDYQQAGLSAEEKQALTQKEEALQNEGIELQTRLRERKEKLQEEKEQKLSEESRENLENRQELVEQELNDFSREITIANKELADSEQNRREMQVQIQRLQGQKQEVQRWQVLHDLIGSADGKKYRNFAQGLSFDIMISHANQQLRKMSDRYILLRSQKENLELKIIDNYQAGEIRSTANLSGGESFLVSLALALGLSQMASRKVSVDSLFLDEGFGSLDEDVLDTALNTLAGLQQDGKLIGIISHVPALKERISTQIEVIPLSGGRSILRGPGCDV